MAIQYTSGTGAGGLGGGATVQDLNAELNALLEEAGGQSIISPGDPNTVILDTRQGFDYTIDTVKLTEGYFSGGDGTIEANVVSTGSEAASNNKYYVNIVNSDSVTQFSVAYGNAVGSGSNARGGTSNPSTLQGETEVVYKQFANLLLSETEVTGGFKISQQGSAGQLSARDEDIYVLVGKRARFKDRMNKGTWTLSLSGSLTNGNAASQLKLTDDSKYNKAQFTVAGPRYNIVSGTAGTVTGSNGAVAKDHRTYGWFYPDAGVMVFSGAELSASIPGADGAKSQIGFFTGTTGTGAGQQLHASGKKVNGFTPNKTNTEDGKNVYRFVNALKVSNNAAHVSLRLRSEEDQTQNNYFCRVRSGALNFSNNPTFTSSSVASTGELQKQIRNKSMWGNPTVYITGVGLYSNAGKLVAIAKMSTPIKKNFSSEATIKVKLTY
tara:strand:+ start:8530 stop:9843 length:1314 start_codon:yes stop_codon:yes gene_type:complete